MALLTINDEKKNVGFETDVVQIEKSPITEISRKIDFDNEADLLYCYLKSVCSKELFDAIVDRFKKAESVVAKKRCMVCPSTDGVKRYKTNIDGQFYANGGDGFVEYCQKHAKEHGYTDEHLHSTHRE